MSAGSALPRADDPMLSSKTPWYFYDGGFVEAGKTPEETLGHWRNPNTVLVDGPPNYYDAKGNGSPTWAPGYKQAVRDGVASTYIPTEYRNNPQLWAQKQAEWARQSGNATVEYNYNNRDWEKRGFYYGGGPDSNWTIGGGSGGGSGGSSGKPKKKKKTPRKKRSGPMMMNTYESYETSEQEMPGSQCASRGPVHFQECCDTKAEAAMSDPSCPTRYDGTGYDAVESSVMPANQWDNNAGQWLENEPNDDDTTSFESSFEMNGVNSVDSVDSVDTNVDYEYTDDMAENGDTDAGNPDAFESFHHKLALAPGRIGQAFGSLWPGWYSWDQMPTQMVPTQMVPT